jgi:enamine deaminase RidA (YjgF/YER057c/UK114 family)
MTSRMSAVRGLAMAAVVLISSLVATTRVAAANLDVVLEWNALAVTTVASQTPYAQARFMAITQLAVFEAVNAITGDYEPYIGTIDAPAGASAEAAAVAAAHTVLTTYLPASAATLDPARTSSLALIADGPAKTCLLYTLTLPTN